ncbi:MAG: tRNA (adenosine(37)-N6)-dimethylallyltransferase MiaA, partial [Chloroflexota bacterium]|nr:tRNA (adenosine(37)-N6)-dimethylallyltransferase MiaA [Chloroflexota bacterium]
DSRQVYRHMDVGTAKPSPEDRARVPHHLIDILDPDQEFSLAGFLELASRAIEEIHARGRIPLLVGGTGQYVWALLEGWRVPHVPPNPSLRLELTSQSPEALYQRLQAVDAEAAARIVPTNVRRVVRALEVFHATGVPFSAWTKKSGPAYRYLALGLTTSRAELYARIDARVDAMLSRGWLDEVRRLLAMGYSPDLPALSSLGYRELAAHLRGELSLDEAAARIKTETHRFARRQYAWFRLRDARIHWLQDREAAPAEAEALVRKFLALDANAPSS